MNKKRVIRKEAEFKKWFVENHTKLGFSKIIRKDIGICPDFIMLKEGKEVGVELETVSSNFLSHKHSLDDVDEIICIIKDMELGKPVTAVDELEFVGNSNKKVTLSIEEDVYNNFQKYCEENAIMLSKKIELFIIEFLKQSLKNKRASLFLVLFVGFLLMNVVSADIIDRGSYWNHINNTDGTYSFEIYNTIVNYYNGSDYMPVDTNLQVSSDHLYDYEATGNYEAYFKEDPTAGLIVKYIKDSVQVEFQAMPLQFGNAISQIDQISIVQPVAGIPVNNLFEYNDVYGTGISLKYSYLNEMLKERLVINSPSDLREPAAYMVAGGNVTLDLTFNIVTNAQHIVIDGADWDKSSTKETRNEVYIKDDFGKVIYYFPKPYAYDSNNSKVGLTYIFKRQGASLYVVLKTNYSWLNSSERVFPVYIDPTIAISGDGKDSYIKEDKVDTNYGTGGDLISKSQINNKENRVLLLFNLSEIPFNVTITNATLELYYNYDSGQDVNLSLYRLTRQWTETGVTWNTYDGTNSWTTAGGDYDSTLHARTLIDSVLSWKSWLITSLVQDLVDKVYENYGFILLSSPTHSEDNSKHFSSKENTNQSLIPRLVVTYFNGSDIIPPYFTSIPLPTTITYGEGFGAEFNADDETEFGSFSVNWTNLFSINESGYLQNITQLAAGIYWINITVNDTSNNLNSTVYQVNVNKASQTASLNINESSPITYGAYINVTCNGELFRDDVDVSGEIGQSILLGVGTYSYSCQLPENQNYSYDEDNQTFVVNEAGFNYSLTVYPLEYIFAARENKDEINSFEISLYDNTNQTVIVNITYLMSPSSNFSFLSSPVSVILNSSDNITNPIKVNVSIQADSNILDGVYNGNITFNVYSQAVTEIMGLTYGINPPSGIPILYSSNDTQCPNGFVPLGGCSYDQSVEQDSSYTVSYKVINNGTYNLQQCSVVSLLGWASLPPTFSLNVSETKEFSITYAPTSQLGVYYDQIYIDCLIGDSLGNRITSSPNNRPINRIKVTQKPSPPATQIIGGGGGGTDLPFKKLEIKNISDMIVDPGENKRMVLGVKNAGTLFLNGCKIRGKGNYSSWISSEETRGLSGGEEHEFIFTLSVPEELKAGPYKIEQEVVCKEFNQSISFIAEIIEGELEVSLVNIERQEDELRVSYSLEEFSNLAQEVKVDIILLGFDNEKIVEITETRSLAPSSRQTYNTFLKIPPDLEGTYNLLINAISETAFDSAQEEVILGGQGIGGLAILTDERRNTIFSIILIILFVVLIFFIVRKILKSRRKKGRPWNWNQEKERFERVKTVNVRKVREG